MTAAVTIEDVKAISTQPGGLPLTIVKVITSEDGLYGLGCATFRGRYLAVHAAIEEHLKPFLRGRDVDQITEIWQMSMVNGYWRNGPVLNNAIAGVASSTCVVSRASRSSSCTISTSACSQSRP